MSNNVLSTKAAIVALIIALAVTPASATIINIPDDYETIQEGIDASSDGDTVLVQPSTYVENINFNGHNIVLGSLFLTTGDTIYISSTIMDGDSTGKVVTFESNENSNVVITGFTIQNGRSDYGGGIFCNDSNPVINNNTISGNSVAVDGGGIFCINNSAPMISNNTISGNYTACCGGGICCWLNSNPVICYNVIINNSVIYNGGGISLLYSSPIVSNNTIIGNSASYGGGIYSFGCALTLINNTITGNSANSNGGGICGGYLIINSILWNNSASEGQQIYGDPDVSYCDVEGGWEGEGNIDADPMFCLSDTAYYWLAENSPCVGSGQNGENMGAFGIGCETTDIFENDFVLPMQFSLSQNYPNPFNPTTAITFSLPKQQHVTLMIYNLLGREVHTLIDEQRQAGMHTVMFDASGLSSGIYFYRLQAGDYSESKRMVLLK